MGERIHKIINSTSAQTSKSALISKEPHEAQDDWESFLSEVAENDNVSPDHRPDGSVLLT
jgi:hypothetical protein